MKLDPKLAFILSDVFKDIGKAYLIQTIVTPQLSGISALSEILLVLTKGLLNSILFILASWYISKHWERKGN